MMGKAFFVVVRAWLSFVTCYASAQLIIVDQVPLGVSLLTSMGLFWIATSLEEQ